MLALVLFLFGIVGCCRSFLLSVESFLFWSFGLSLVSLVLDFGVVLCKQVFPVGGGLCCDTLSFFKIRVYLSQKKYTDYLAIL